jgi:hypothetical protein
MVVVMSVAHLFVQLQGPDEMPLQAQSSATARTCIPRERTAGLHCMSVVSSQGGMAANGQGSVAESTCRLVGWSHKAPVQTKRLSCRRALSKDNGLV